LFSACCDHGDQSIKCCLRAGATAGCAGFDAAWAAAESAAAPPPRATCGCGTAALVAAMLAAHRRWALKRATRAQTLWLPRGALTQGAPLGTFVPGWPAHGCCRAAAASPACACACASCPALRYTQRGSHGEHFGSLEVLWECVVCGRRSAELASSREVRRTLGPSPIACVGRVQCAGPCDRAREYRFWASCCARHVCCCAPCGSNVSVGSARPTCVLKVCIKLRSQKASARPF